MRFAPIGIIAVLLVVIAVAVAGCSGSGPSPQTGGGTQAAGTPSSGSSASGSSAGSGVSGADLFGGLSYNWVEYKINAGSGSEGMTIYYKFNKQTGKCTMRFEGAGASNIPAGMQEMDCSGKGTQGSSATDPNAVKSDAKVSCSPLEESVTVPAGTFSAIKCTTTTDGNTASTWIAKGKFVVKMESSSTQGGSMSMVLNSYG